MAKKSKNKNVDEQLPDDIVETNDGDVVETMEVMVVATAETTEEVVVPVETTEEVVATTETVVEPVETTEEVVETTEEIRYEIEEDRLPILFIIPYREREQQHAFFSQHMKTIMGDIPHKMLYIHQLDTREFNRGAMKNIGFLAAKKMYPDTYKQMTLVFNDIDTMPITPGYLNYETTSGTIKHFYGFQFTLGGIVSITGEDFERMNGFPNLWAWGFEDNELQKRALRLGITIDRTQFHPFMDKNILQLQDGLSRKVNKSEYDIFQSNTSEGIGSLTNVQYIYDDATGFVSVSEFNTQREEDVSARSVHDLRKGAVPFPQPQMYKRAGSIKMFFYTF